MKVFSFYDEVHEQWFWAAIGGTVQKLESFVRKHYRIKDDQFDLSDVYDAEGLCFSVCNPKDQSGIWIWVKDYKPKDPAWISTLSHECAHAAKQMLFNRGFDLGHPGDEPMAYQVGYLMKKILTTAKKRAR